METRKRLREEEEECIVFGTTQESVKRMKVVDIGLRTTENVVKPYLLSGMSLMELLLKKKDSAKPVYRSLDMNKAGVLVNIHSIQADTSDLVDILEINESTIALIRNFSMDIVKIDSGSIVGKIRKIYGFCPSSAIRSVTALPLQKMVVVFYDNCGDIYGADHKEEFAHSLYLCGITSNIIVVGGSNIAYGDCMGNVFFYDIRTCTKFKAFQPTLDSIKYISYDEPSNRMLIIDESHMLTVWDYKDMRVVSSRVEHDLVQACIIPSGKILAYTYRSVFLYSDNLMDVFAENEQFVNLEKVEYSETLGLVLAFQSDSSITLMDPTTLNIKKKIEPYELSSCKTNNTDTTDVETSDERNNNGGDTIQQPQDKSIYYAATTLKSGVIACCDKFNKINFWKICGNNSF